MIPVYAWMLPAYGDSVFHSAISWLNMTLHSVLLQLQDQRTNLNLEIKVFK